MLIGGALANALAFTGSNYLFHRLSADNKMAEEPQQVTAKEPQQVTTKEPQRVTKEPQQVVTKNPKKVEAGKRLAESNRKKREAKKREQAKFEASKPILRNLGCCSFGSYRWSWLLRLSNQESRATTTK